MSLSRKKQIAIEVQMDFGRDNELAYAEDFAMDSALRFLLGSPWNNDETICDLAIDEGLDGELIWLASRVLFAPAVVHIATGKPV